MFTVTLNEETFKFVFISAYLPIFIYLIWYSVLKMFRTHTAAASQVLGTEST